MYTISGAYATLFAIFTNFHRCSRLAISLRRSRPLKMTSPRKVTTLMIRQLTQGMLRPSMRKNSRIYGKSPTPMFISRYTSALAVNRLWRNAKIKLHTSVTLHKIGTTRSRL